MKTKNFYPDSALGAPTFPADLLKKSDAERISYFKSDVKIRHPFMRTVLEQAFDVVTSSAGADIVIVAGPSGVGKTTLGLALTKVLRGHYSQKSDASEGCIPVMFCSAVPATRGFFDWRDFYIRLLNHSGEVLVDRKIRVPINLELFPEPRNQIELQSEAPPTLRRSVEKCLRERGTKVLVIDESHHILMVDQKALEIQFENLKSLAEQAGVRIVMLGTYRLLDIRDGSGQLVRRSKIIPFPRYDDLDEAHMEGYYSAFVELVQRLPLDKTPDLLPHVAYIHEKSAGCIGILKDWLTRGLEHAITKKVKLTKAVMSEIALSNKELVTLMSEAFEGEEKLRDLSDSEFRERLAEIRAQCLGDLSVRKIERASNRPPGKRKFGKRKPTRDPVGVPNVC